MDLGTFEEQLLNYLPANMRYMARNQDGSLYLYEEHPFKSYEKGKEGTWDHDCGTCEKLALPGIYESVKWTDDYPWNFRQY